MLNKFIDQTAKFVSNSGIDLPQLELLTVEKNEGGGLTHTMNLSDVLFGASRMPNNIILQSALVFAVIDAKVDVLQSRLIGKKLEEKYNSLPATTDSEIIFKEFYRILRIIRNKAIHNMNHINVTNGNVEVLNGLRIPESSLKTIYSYILDTLCIYKVPDAFYDGITRTVYDGIVANTQLLKSGDSLLPISSDGLRLKWNRHLRLIHAQYAIDNGKLVLDALDKSKRQPSDGLAYEIEYQGSMYLIPEEVLDVQSAIMILDLAQWKN